MSARRPLFLVLIATVLLLVAAGCGGNGNAIVGDENSDPLYQHAQELRKEGRLGEALSAYLHVIDRRGENGAPESQLEAGNLCLNYTHEPVEAYHHFSKYLELQPNGPRSDMVRGQREAAKREIIRTFVSPGDNNQVVRLNSSDDVDRLNRRIRELEAELETLHGGGSVPVSPMMRMPTTTATTPPTISLDDSASTAAPAATEESQAQSSAPVTEPPRESQFTRGLSGAPYPRPTQPTSGVGGSKPPPVLDVTANTPSRPAATPTRPGQPTRPTAPSSSTTTSARWTHTVGPGEKSLWGIARRYYGAKTNTAAVNGIYEANRNVMRSPGDLRPGMVLRIP